MKQPKTGVRPWVVLLYISAVAFLGSACAPPSRNDIVVVFMLDTLRQDALGCHGNPLNTTPHIDGLARDGVRFKNAISASGWTLPAVGSLLTGTWPSIHGATGKGVALTPIRDEIPTAPEILKQQGFRTVAIANAAFVSPMLGVHRGFDVFNHKYSYNDDGRIAGEVVDLAIKQLDESKGRNSFFFIHLFDPHLTYAPPPGFDTKYAEGRTSPELPITAATCFEMQRGPKHNLPPSAVDQRYIRAAYLGEVSYMDEQVGRFLNVLRTRGLYDDATIVVTSDHGEEFWEHGGFEHGHSLYDELVHVPLIIKPPAHIDVNQKVIQNAVRVLDVMPTIFEAIGVDSPASFEGKSMLPIMRGEREEARTILMESTLYGSPKIAWRTERYKYIHDATAGPDGIGELYDLQADPGESQNVSAQQLETAKRMRKQLFDFYFELRRRSDQMSAPDPVDLSPTRIRQLKSLGYIR